MKAEFRIAFIGSGNTAHSLGYAFRKAGHRITAVYSRNPAHSRLLARKLKSRAARSLQDAVSDANICILAVSDSSVPKLASQFKNKNLLVIHTSGSVPLAALSKHCQRCGVLYPLQSMSKGVETDFRNVPFFIEAVNPREELAIRKLAESISTRVIHARSGKRASVHLAAVFANNFTNCLFTIAEKILQKEKIPFDVLLPLIEETVAKIKKVKPEKVQTGPAIRNDRKVIRTHLKALEQDPAVKKLYADFSRLIGNIHSQGR